MGFKRLCPLAPLRLGHQHIPVLLHRRSSSQLCGSRTVLQARPSCRLLPPLPLPRAALRGPWAAQTPPPILYRCGRLSAPCDPQSCGGRHGIMRPWCAEIACAGGCCQPMPREGVWPARTPEMRVVKILTQRLPHSPNSESPLLMNFRARV